MKILRWFEFQRPVWSTWMNKHDMIMIKNKLKKHIKYDIISHFISKKSEEELAIYDW